MWNKAPIQQSWALEVVTALQKCLLAVPKVGAYCNFNNLDSRMMRKWFYCVGFMGGDFCVFGAKASLRHAHIFVPVPLRLQGAAKSTAYITHTSLCWTSFAWISMFSIEDATTNEVVPCFFALLGGRVQLFNMMTRKQTFWSQLIKFNKHAKRFVCCSTSVFANIVPSIC
jgi:hypothetical protein